MQRLAAWVWLLVTAAVLVPSSSFNSSGVCRWEDCLVVSHPIKIFEPDLPSGCRTRWERVASIPIDAYTVGDSDLRVLRYPAPFFDQINRVFSETDCRVPAGWRELGELDAKAGRSCAEAHAAVSAASPVDCLWCSGGGADSCISDFFRYRFEIVRAVSRAISPELVDKKTLVNQFFAEALSESRSLERLLGIASRIVQTDPTDLDAQAQKLDVLYALWISATTPESRAQWKGLYEDAFNGLRAQFPRDPLRTQWLTLARMHLDISVMESTAKEMLAENPDSDTPLYYLAWARYLRNDAVGASRLLRQAVVNQDGTWDEEARIGLKRLLSLDEATRQRKIFYDPDLLFGYGLVVEHRNETLAVGGLLTSLAENGIYDPKFPEVKEQVRERYEWREVRTDREEALAREVRAALLGRDWKKAADKASEWLDLNPWSRGAYAMSQEAFWSFIHFRHPKDTANVLRLSGLLVRQGRYEEGLKVLKSVTFGPESRESANNLKEWATIMQKRERQLAEARRINPRSESAHYELASFFFEHRRFEEAEEALKTLFELNEAHHRGKKMHLSMIEVRRQQADPEVVQEIIGKFLSEDLARFIAEVSPLSEEQEKLLDEITRERIIAKYRESSHSGHAFENEPASAWWEIRDAEERDAKGAEVLHRARIARFPASSQAAVGFVHFLIKQDRVDEAENELTRIETRFPGDGAVRILKDRLTDIRRAPSEEQNELAKEALWRDLLMWKAMLAESSRGLREGSETFKIRK